MRSLSRRRVLQSTRIVAGVSVIAGFPKLFPAALAKNDPPKSSKASKKTVSQAKPTTKKSNKNSNKNTNKKSNKQ
jgi:hypothetical protein